MSRSIPDRWLDYTPIGKPIKGTRFIAFKVPLSPGINNGVQNPRERLEISQILEEIPNLGLVIDLTNTYRYYKPENFSSNGVRHIKLMIPGKAIPSQHLVEKFANYVKEFSENDENAGKLIGVHCTHGLNRTGYLVCHYMINHLQIDPDEAIKDFEEARGHRMERINYINALKNNPSDEDQEDDNKNTRDKTPESWRSKIPRSDNHHENNIDRCNWRSSSPRRDFRNAPYRSHSRERNYRNGRSVQHSVNGSGEDRWRSSRPNQSEYTRPAYNEHKPQNRRDRRVDSRNRFANPYDGSRYNWRRGGEQENGSSYNDASRGRRDMLPSNDSSYSVMDNLYGDANQGSYGRFNRR